MKASRIAVSRCGDGRSGRSGVGVEVMVEVGGVVVVVVDGGEDSGKGSEV